MCLCVSLFHRIQERKILKSRTWNEEETRISLVGVCRYREEEGGGQQRASKPHTRRFSVPSRGFQERERESPLPMDLLLLRLLLPFSFYLEEEEEAVAAKRTGIDGRV